MRRRITKIENRSNGYREVTASQQNLVSLHKRPSGGCVRVRLCVFSWTAGPPLPTRQQKERMSTSLAAVSVGGQRLSVWFTLRRYKLHYPASRFSVTVCKCSQQPPWPPCIRLRPGSGHRGREHNVCSHGQVPAAPRSRARRVMQTNWVAAVSLVSPAAVTPHSHTHTHITSTRAHSKLITCAALTAVAAAQAEGAFPPILMCFFYKPTLSKTAKILHCSCSFEGFQIPVLLFDADSIRRSKLCFLILQVFSWVYVFSGCKMVICHFTFSFSMFIILLCEQSRLSLPQPQLVLRRLQLFDWNECNIYFNSCISAEREYR